MFGYSPTENDQSGRILAGGIVGSSETRANTMKQLGSDIGGALQSIGGIYGGMSQQADMGDSAYEALGAIGEMYPGMKSTFGALGKLDDRTRRLASLSILDNLGAVSQLGIAGMRDKMMPVMQAQRVTDQRDIMYERERLQREREAMKNPPAPSAVQLPAQIRRF